MSTNPKSTRSRFSSPLQLSSSPSGHHHHTHNHSHNSNNNNNNNNNNHIRASTNSGGGRAFMQRWLEPPVQNKASYQEAGLMKAGVVENMAPLGTLPKAAITKKSGMPGEHSHAGTTPLVKKIVLKKPKPLAEVAAPIALADGNSTPPPLIPGISSEAEDPDVMVSPSSQQFLMPVVDDGEDDDYVPQKSSKARRSSLTISNKSLPNSLHSASLSAMNAAAATRRQSSRRKSARPSPPPPSSPIPSAASASTPASPSRVVQPPPSTTPSRLFEERQLADKVVEQAVEQAIEHCRYPTAYALRNLYDERYNDPHFVSMLGDIFHQRADQATLREFNRIVLEKKKFGKKHNYAFEYFVPEEIPLPKPRPAPYGPLVHMDLSIFKELAPDADGRATKKLRIEKEKTMETTPSRPTAANLDAKPDVTMTDASAVNGGLDLRLNGAPTISTMGPTTNPIPPPTTTSTTTTDAAAAAVAVHAAPLVAVKAVAAADMLAPMAAAATPSRNGIKHTKSPRGRKKRSGSVSSTSSLSSVPDDIPEDFEEFMDQVDDDLAVSRPRSAEGNEMPNPAGSTQPISIAQIKSAAKKKNASHRPATHHHPSTNSVTTTNSNSHSSDASMSMSMPSVVTTNGASHPHKSNHQTPASLKFASKYGDLDSASKGWSKSKLEKRAENRRITTTASADSFVRDGLLADEPAEDALPVALPSAVVTPAEQPRSSRTPALSSRAARAAKRHHDEVDDSVSPTTASFQAGLEPSSSSRRNSRAATPQNLRSAKKPRGGLRVKTSPMKKKGTSAGIPRGGGERPSPAANGAQQNQDDNDDSCYTCGGNGELVCCDGCTFSFHFLCIDPPMSEGHMPDEWFCNQCAQRYFPPIGERKGALSDLLSSLEPKNPRAFRLPEDVRDHFEGVKTGPEGEYEDSTPVAKPKTNKKGYEESFDFFRVKNPDGTPALCHLCHKGAADDRPLIPCSISGCGLNWHLECLDPPLAVPPPPRTWRCPAHVDDVLPTLKGSLGPAHKYRKVKHVPVIEQAFSRGMANNGWIEIEEDSDDDDDDAWRHHKGYGRVFRLSEKGIKLDFISRVHERRSQTPARVATPNPAFAVAPSARSIAEQQAALNLSQLAQGGNDGVNQLVQAMVSEASPALVSVMANGDAERIASGNLSSADATTLNAMLAQADSLKSAIGKILASRAAATVHPATPGAITAHPATPADTPEKTSSALSHRSAVGASAPAATLDLSRTANVHNAAAQDRVGDEITRAKEDSAMQVD